MDKFRKGYLSLLIWMVSSYCNIAPAASYRIENLGIPGRSTTAGALNELGDVVVTTLPGSVVGNDVDGYALDPPGATWRIDTSGKATELIGLGGPQDQAVDLNNAGIAVGYSQTEFLISTPQAMVWDGANGTSLPQPSNVGGITRAKAINNSGQILVTNESSPAMTFLYSNIDGYEQVPSVPDMETFGADINDLGQVTGVFRSVSSDPNPVSMPFLWDANGAIELGSLGGTSGSATAMNNNGQIVGTSETESGKYHGFIWDRANGMRDIGTLNGLWSTATDVNELGVVVGTLYDPQISQPSLPFIYDTTNGMRLLEEFFPSNSGWHAPFQVESINNRGQILGSGQLNGLSQVFLLTPIPEPTTLALTLVCMCLPLVLRS